jgi:hypothetical protein
MGHPFQQPAPPPSEPPPFDPASLLVGQLAHAAATARFGLDSMIRDQVAQFYPQYLSLYDFAYERQATEMSLSGKSAHERKLADKVDELRLRQEASTRIAEENKAALLDETAWETAALEFGADVLDSENLDQIELPDPLVHNFLDMDSLARLWGPSNSLKSFVALDMAGCVAVGVSWHGNAVRQSKVLYVVAEGSSGIFRRVRAWERQNGRKMSGVAFYPRPVQVGDEEQMRRLIAFAKLGGYGFVVFDTQARCTLGVDENSNTEMGQIVASLDALRIATGACVLLVHHSGNEAERARGASSMMGAMDAEFSVKRPSPPSLAVELKTVKRKDGAQADRMLLEGVELAVTTPRGEETSLAIVSRDVAATSGGMSIPKLTGKQAETLRVMDRWADQTASVITEAMSMDPRKQRSLVEERLRGLQNKGCVRKTGSRWAVTDLGKATLNELNLCSQGLMPYETT